MTATDTSWNQLGRSLWINRYSVWQFSVGWAQRCGRRRACLAGRQRPRLHPTRSQQPAHHRHHSVPRVRPLTGTLRQFDPAARSGSGHTGKKNAFSRRVPDLVTEELVAVLSRRSSFEFKELFDIVHENLRARNAASGGEEMLRLRAYEKLQNLVARGAVKKNGKKYRGLPSALASAIAQQNGHLSGVK